MLRRHVPDLFVTLSHEILREFREYERTSTTVLNAFVGPRVSNYLGRFESFAQAARFAGKIAIMRSNGGTMSIGQARREPVAMMESGPVAGMIGAGRLASLIGIERAIGFDMGGTTAKCTLITSGVAPIEEGYVIGDEFSGQPMQLPVVDIVEVGAGGGSLAWCDAGGALHVGPVSAGADPGPACYGRGGAAPAVTDADLVLGRLNGERFLGGHMKLDRALAETAVAPIGERLGLGTVEAALGITTIADGAMSLAVRAVSVDRGIDPRDTALIAFGGAGPLHAVAIAREIAIPRVIIPKLPGNFSALGMLMAEWRHDFVRTLVGPLGEISSPMRCAPSRSCAPPARKRSPAIIFRAAASTSPPTCAIAGRSTPSRYPSAAPPISRATPRRPGSLQRAARSPLRPCRARPIDRGRQSAPHRHGPAHGGRHRPLAVRSLAATETMPEQRRPVVFDDPARPLEARILWRPALAAGTEIVGPAVIEEPNSTTLIGPGDHAVVDAQRAYHHHAGGLKWVKKS